MAQYHKFYCFYESQSEPGCTTRCGCTPTLAHLQLGCGARCTPHVQLLLVYFRCACQLQYTCSLGVVQVVLLMYTFYQCTTGVYSSDTPGELSYGIGHGTPGRTPGNKKVHFSSTPQPQGGVLLVVHPTCMYSRTRSGYCPYRITRMQLCFLSFRMVMKSVLLVMKHSVNYLKSTKKLTVYQMR